MKEDKYLLTDKTANVFIEFEHLRKLNKYVSNNTRIYCSNISKRKEEVLSYIRMVSLLSAELEKKIRTGYTVRMGYIFNVMLPKYFDLSAPGSKKKISKLAQTLVTSVDEGNKMKYFAIIKHEGNATILKIVIPDRIYYPDGKTITYTTYNKEKTEDIFISRTKIRLSHFATRTKMSNKIFREKMYELKLEFLRILDVNVKLKVVQFSKKFQLKMGPLF